MSTSQGKQFAQDAADVLNMRIDDLIKRMAPLGGKARRPAYASVYQQHGGEWHATAATVEFDVEGGMLLRVTFPSIAGSAPTIEIHASIENVSDDAMKRVVDFMRACK